MNAFCIWDRTAMMRESKMEKREWRQYGARVAFPLSATAQTIHQPQPLFLTSLGLVITALARWNGTQWLRKCLSMPPTPRKRVWSWLMETKSK
ncbi:MAG: hypothetical protein NWQ64_09400, partial [Paracoccaceae bacterium]|nr:hypothetical protein [Paracoccaceae bacterium]